MTVFKDIKNNEYVADTEIKLTEGVNGEKSLTGTIYFGNDVKKNLAKGWTMVFNDEEYAIVTFRYNDTDNTVSFSAVQMFFYTLSVKAFHEKWNGSHPLNEYLNAIFEDTGYSYINETSTAAFEKENWGLKDKLSLFNDIINQISAEFEVKGKTVYIKDKIGSDLSTVVRQGFNLSTAEIETDSSSFATYGIGYGVHDDVDDQTSPRLSVEYYSPLYDMYKDKFGAIEAEPVDDERYTISDNLLAAVKKKVDNSWSLSITVSLLDLQNAGYPYAMASAGDSITIVDESLGFEDEVRIIKVVSSYNINGERISVDVTCGDLTMAQAQSASSSVATSTITDIINGNSVLPDAWFSEQMQLATNSLLAARTELKFTDQGIIAIDKTDHNKMVILNSAGIGVSTDGGQTFKTAITAESIDGQNINIKNINGSNIVANSITADKIQADSMLVSLNSTLQTMQIGTDGLYTTDNKGDGVGHIHTNSVVGHPNVYGLNFDLDDTGDYMAWGAKNRGNPNGNYDIKLGWYRSDTANTTGNAKGFVFSDQVTLNGGIQVSGAYQNLGFGTSKFRKTNYPYFGSSGMKAGLAYGGVKTYLISDGKYADLTKIIFALQGIGTAYIPTKLSSDGKVSRYVKVNL